MSACSEVVRQHGAESIYILFASPGGSVHDSLALYNFLRALPVNLVMHNISHVDSVATVIFLAGHERYACPQSKFLFHGIRFNVSGKLTTSGATPRPPDNLWG